jgi:hypothetical protein
MNVETFRSQMQQQEVNKRGQQDMGPAATRLSGEIRVNGAGETKAEITFPIRFSEKPKLSFGAELLEEDPIVAGFMPYANVVVLGWITQERPPTSRLYVGARLGIITGGVHHQKMVVHWHLEGSAITYP